MGKNRIAAFGISLLSIFIIGCSNGPVLYSKPAIAPSISWKWYEACGYRCKPMVDFFESEGIKIRLESFNYKNTFTIFSFFICRKNDIASLNPEKVFVQLNDGNRIFAKARRPGFNREESQLLERLEGNYLEFLRISTPLTGDLLLNMPYTNDELYRPISFFFDVKPPHPSEEFELYIEGLTKNGEHVVVPVIKFGPAIIDSGDGIPLETDPNG
jgi:hypothetical protein